MAAGSLERAVREVAELDASDAKKVRTAASRLVAALHAEVQSSVAQAVRALKADDSPLDDSAVDVSPLDVSPVDDSSLDVSLAERMGGLAEATEAGERFRDRVWGSEEMLSSDHAAEQLNMSREALNKQRHGGKVLGLEATKRGVRFPRWQFEDRVRPSVAKILAALPHLDPWGHYLFFTQVEPLLGGLSPLEALRKKRASEVLAVARLLAAEATGPG